MAEREKGPGGSMMKQSGRVPDAGWARREREAAFSPLTETGGYQLPKQASVSREFSDSRYREVTARISATTKDLEAVIVQRDRERSAGRGIPEALTWTVGAAAVAVLGVVLGELAAAAGSAILEGQNE